MVSTWDGEDFSTLMSDDHTNDPLWKRPDFAQLVDHQTGTIGRVVARRATLRDRDSCVVSRFIIVCVVGCLAFALPIWYVMVSPGSIGLLLCVDSPNSDLTMAFCPHYGCSSTNL